MKKTIIIFLTFIVIIIVIIALLYIFSIIPHKQYSNSDFNIETYISDIDKDNDGIDDQTDILKGAYEYLDTNPKYKSRYYADTGYPDDNCGVCTDVVAFALRDAGYDLMELVNADIKKHPDDYDIETPDKCIDFRRVENLFVFFENNAVKLTTNTEEIESWQAGDIVVFKNHIGIVSDHRNKDGVPFVLHNASVIQASYEEDVLDIWGEIIGHYRMSWNTGEIYG